MPAPIVKNSVASVSSTITKKKGSGRKKATKKSTSSHVQNI